MQQVDGLALRGECERLRDHGFAHAVQRGFLLVHHVADLRLRRLDVPVEIHDARGLLHDAAHGGGQREPALVGRAVDFGDHRLEHGRTGRHLGDGDRRAILGGDGGDGRAHAFGDVVALVRTLALAHEVDLHVGHGRAAAQEVVAHESVEIKRRGGAGVDLHVAHLGLAADGVGHLAGDAGGVFERGALGRVEHDLELRLVVEGQHLDLHRADQHEAAGEREQADDAAEKRPAHARPVEQRLHHAVIEARGPVVRRVVVVGRGGRAGLGQVALEHADCGPRRDGKRDRQREEHGGGRADRDRAHVRAHQTADERHRQDRGDHGPGGQDGRVAHFVDGFERDLHERLFLRTGQAHVAHDVFDDHDGVVHQDADGEDQREERDAVERVPVEVKNQQREREGRGDGEEHDERFAPAEEKQDEQRHAEDGDAHVQQQFVALFGGGVAVVARDRHRHVVGQQRAAERVDLGEHGVDDVDRVGAWALGERERDGGLGRAFAGEVQHVVGGLLGGVGDGGDVAQVHRAILVNAHDDLADVGGVAQERAGFEQRLGVGKRPRAGAELAVGRLERRDERGGAESARGEGGGIELHAHGAAHAADQRGLRDLRDGFDLVVELGGEPAQREVVVRGAVQRECEHRHVVDGARLDQRRADAGRDAVEIGLELLVEAHERGLQIGADLETHDGHHAAGAGGRVEVLHAGDFPEQFLHRARGAVFHLQRGGAGHADEYVDHRHLDLRLLLARQHEHREQAEQDRCDDDDGRQLRVDEHRAEFAGDALRAIPAVFRGVAHGRTSTG